MRPSRSGDHLRRSGPRHGLLAVLTMCWLGGAVHVRAGETVRQGPGWSHPQAHLGIVGPLQGRPLPANAVPRPGIDTLNYPEVGARQVARLGLEVLGASVWEGLRHPFTSLTHVVGRSTERVGVRLAEFGTTGRRHLNLLATDPAEGSVDAGVGSPLMPARLTLLPSSESAIQALLALIAGSTSRVDLMMYGWEDDPTGREVASALAEAAARGVVVRLLVDRGADVLHNPDSATHRSTLFDRLAEVPGIQLIRAPDPFLEFDHRKLACIDGRVAWSGGMILTEVARRRWENLAFLIEGPAVTQYAALFEERGAHVGGSSGSPRLGPGGLPERLGSPRADRPRRAVVEGLDLPRGRSCPATHLSRESVLQRRLARREARCGRPSRC
ncbi:MAG: phospholipase D-like domain-containing protein [Isosphaeraceae bacterium]